MLIMSPGTQSISPPNCWSVSSGQPIGLNDIGVGTVKQAVGEGDGRAQERVGQHDQPEVQHAKPVVQPGSMGRRVNDHPPEKESRSAHGHVHQRMHLIVAQRQVEGPGELPQVQAAHEEEHGEDGVSQKAVHPPNIVVLRHGADDPLPRPGRHPPQHRSQRRAQQDEHRGHHSQNEMLRLVEGEQVVG